MLLLFLKKKQLLLSFKESQRDVGLKSCTGGGVEIPEYMLRVLTEDYRREFNERIKRSVCFFVFFLNIFLYTIQNTLRYELFATSITLQYLTGKIILSPA